MGGAVVLLPFSTAGGALLTLLVGSVVLHLALSLAERFKHHDTDNARQAAAFLREDKPDLAEVPLYLQWDLIRGLRSEVPGWQSDPDLLADEALLKEYLAVLNSPAAGDTAQRGLLADSLDYAAFRKLQTAAR